MKKILFLSIFLIFNLGYSDLQSIIKSHHGDSKIIDLNAVSKPKDSNRKVATGGYIDGKWYSFYNNTYLERSCIQLIGDDVEGYGCPYYHADEIYLNEEDPSEFTITGIAEIGDEILLNISDFKLKIDGEAYTTL